MNTKFDFADKFGFEEKFDFQEQANELYSGHINLKKLLEYLGADFNNEREPNEVVLVGRAPFDSKDFYSDLIADRVLKFDGGVHEINTRINKRVDYLDYSRIYIHEHRFGWYEIFISYESDSLKRLTYSQLKDQAAIELSFLNLTDVVVLLSFFRFNFSWEAINEAYDILVNAIPDLTKEDADTKIISRIPLEILWRLEYGTLEALFFKVLGYDYHFNARESRLIKLIEAIEAHKEFHPDKFLEKLLTKIGEVSALKRLIKQIDGEEFKVLIPLLWGIWKRSSYSSLDPKQNKVLKDVGNNQSIFLYKSTKLLGFHIDNAKVEWKDLNNIQIFSKQKTGKTREVDDIQNIGDDGKYIPIKIGTKDVDEYDIYQFDYNPLRPIIFMDSENPYFIFRSENKNKGESILLPAFVFYAHKESAMWENVFTSVEYALDIATTFSGVGNILKAGRLLKVLKAGKTIRYRSKQATKIIRGVKVFAGTVEISSGTVNILLKLTGGRDTKLGRAISEYLFYLELLSLSGELTAALHGAIKKSADNIINNNVKQVSQLERKAKKVIKRNIDEYGVLKKTDEVDEAIETIKTFDEIRGVAGISRKAEFAIVNRTDVKKFIEDAKWIAETKFTPEQAYENLMRVLPHFNYRIVDGKIENMSMSNCTDVVKAVDEFLKTGKFRRAEIIEARNISVLEKEYGGVFLEQTIPGTQRIMKEGERGIIFGERAGDHIGHVFNVIKKDGKILLIDGQIANEPIVLNNGFIHFKYMKTS